MQSIETNRLIIRNFVSEDWKALQAIVLDFQASPYAAYDYRWPTSDEEIQGICGWFANGDDFLAVCRRDAPGAIGYIALNGGEDPAERNLGYNFITRAQGQGYAAEACRAVIHHAFTQLGLLRIASGTASANTPSCRLLTKLGFRTTGEHTGSFRTTPEEEPIVFKGYSFLLTKEEWEAKGSA